MNTKKISIGVITFLVLVVFFATLKVRLVGSPALALRLGQPTYVNSDKGQIVVDSANVGDEVKSPLVVTGKVRGFWFYENAFPILIYDENGAPMGRGIALAQDTVTTHELVPFKAIVTFEPFGKKGTIVLSGNENPLGSTSTHSASIPVSFDN